MSKSIAKNRKKHIFWFNKFDNKDNISNILVNNEKVREYIITIRFIRNI